MKFLTLGFYLFSRAGEDAKWSCYVCNSTPIFHLVEQCRAVLEALSQNVCKRRLVQGNVKERIKKKEARQKTNPRLSVLPLVSEPNTMPPTYLPLFEPTQQTFNRSFVRTIGSLIPMANIHQTISMPSANITSVHSMFPDCVAARASVASSVEVINELMSASSSRLKLLMLLNEELLSAGQRSSSLESMPTLAKERRKIAERLWTTHNSYLHFFHDVVQRLLRPTAQSVDMLKNWKAMARRILPRPEPQAAPATLSMAAAQDGPATCSSSSSSWKESISIQNSLAENPPAFPLCRDVLSVPMAALQGCGTIATENSQSDHKQVSRGAEEQPEILFTNKRGRKRKYPPTH